MMVVFVRICVPVRAENMSEKYVKYSCMMPLIRNLTIVPLSVMIVSV